ncbi:MAG: hypothetical protein ACE5GA_05965, partial [Candidatus Zixiibacteriota bacterium]
MPFDPELRRPAEADFDRPEEPDRERAPLGFPDDFEREPAREAPLPDDFLLELFRLALDDDFELR